MADFARMPVIDETEPSEGVTFDVSHHPMYALRGQSADPVERSKLLDLLLDNVSRQTSLKFKLDRGEVWMWYIEEE